MFRLLYTFMKFKGFLPYMDFLSHCSEGIVSETEFRKVTKKSKFLAIVFRNLLPDRSLYCSDESQLVYFDETELNKVLSYYGKLPCRFIGGRGV